jgi:hypothetical protein
MKKLYLVFVLVLVLALSACNMPKAQPSQSPDTIFTQAALTVEAQLTHTAPQVTPTLGVPTVPNVPTTTSFTLPTVQSATITPTPICDLAQFVKDVDVPDGTRFDPGESFTKTWRLKNIGDCTWSGYSLVFDGGESMSGSSPTALPTVAPDQEIDIKVSLKAPTSPGTFRGYWRIRNTAGTLIPVAGGYQAKSFYVEIKVGSSGFDLYTQAAAAQWSACADPCTPELILTFGGPDTDANGFAMYKPAAKLEDGTTPNKILETHPMWVDNGQIKGLYPSYTVVSGDHFKAKIGFLAQTDGSCGTGNVKFQLSYKIGGTLTSLATWTETCDGTMTNVDINLSSLAGQTAQFMLVAHANGSAGQDWAVWMNPRIEP